MTANHLNHMQQTASTYFRMDPKEKTVALLFIQHMPYDPRTLEKFSTLFYQSIAD